MADLAEGPESRKVAQWIERHVGGRVQAVRRQPRWRPVWFVDLELDGEVRELCVRGERVDAEIGFSLDHEMRFQQLLERHDLPVAHVYGWIDDPRAYVMDAVPGQADFRGVDENERDAVMRDYMQTLARLHALPVEPFAEADIVRARTPKESSAIGLQRYEQAYRARKRRPDPFLEFCLAWIGRHPLDPKGREAPVVWDSGQFHHRDGRIQALLDLEIGHVGDPMMDLAGFRMRDSIIGYGDMPTLYAWYAEASGAPVDLEAIQHHHFVFTLTNQLAFHTALAEPVPGSDYMTNLQWCSETNLYAVEALAEILAIELEPTALPEARRSPVAAAHQHLIHSLRHLDAGSEYAQHEVRIAFRLARHLARFDEIGESVVEADLDDLEALLGKRPGSWQEGDAALEHFVTSDDGRHDEALVHLFHRRLSRAHGLLGPAGSAMARHNPIQGFR